MTFLGLVVPVHILAASTALATLAVPMVAKKGGALHRRVGRVYVWAMAAATSTGAAASLWRLVILRDPTQRLRSLFLLYASLMAAASVLVGVRALGAKNRTAPRRRLADLILPSLLVAGGLGLVGYGVKLGAALLMSFAPVGILLGVGQLVFWLRAPRTRFAWWFEHMGGMIGSGIAALTAFMVVNAPRIHLPRFSIWVWLGPTVVGVPGLLVWRAYYARRFAARAAG